MWIPLILFLGFVVLWLARNAGFRWNKTIQPTQPSPPPPAPAPNPTQGGTLPPANAQTPAPKATLGGCLGSLIVIVGLVALASGFVWIFGEEHEEAKRPVLYAETVDLEPGPWRKVEEIDWKQVKTGFQAPNVRTYNVNVQTTGEWCYAAREPNGHIVVVTPKNDNDVVFRAKKGQWVQLVSLSDFATTVKVEWKE